MKKKKTIIILFFLGFFILLFPYISKFINGLIFKHQAESFYEMDISNNQINDLMDKSKKCNKEIFINAERFRDPFNNTNSASTNISECLNLYDNNIFAILEVPKLNLIIPIYLGSSKEILRKGVGQVEGSSIPVGGTSTHTVLAGHRGMATKEMFLNLEEVVSGDFFYIHTLKETLKYEVYEQKVIYPNQTEFLEIREGEDLATLITCHPKYQNYQRLLIQGERVK